MTSNRSRNVGFWRSPFIQDVKLWVGTIAFCLLLSLDYVGR
ncbi:hypothetical protein [Gordonia bronchialis]|nr:hypothetical protein [Gordonia bronchialis]